MNTVLRKDQGHKGIGEIEKLSQMRDEGDMTIKCNVEPWDRERTLDSELMTFERSLWSVNSVVPVMISWFWSLYLVMYDVDIRRKKLCDR